MEVRDSLFLRMVPRFGSRWGSERAKFRGADDGLAGNRAGQGSLSPPDIYSIVYSLGSEEVAGVAARTGADAAPLDSSFSLESALLSVTPFPEADPTPLTSWLPPEGLAGMAGGTGKETGASPLDSLV